MKGQRFADKITSGAHNFDVRNEALLRDFKAEQESFGGSIQPAIRKAARFTVSHLAVSSSVRQLMDVPIRPPFPLTWVEISDLNSSIVSNRGFLAEHVRTDDYEFIRVILLEQSKLPNLTRLMAISDFNLDEAGRLKTITWSDGMRQAYGDDVHEIVSWVEAMVRMPLALINVKNIEIVDAPTPRLSKKARRRGKKNPALTFKTIQLPGATGTSTPGTGDVRDLAWHLVRGHFATYTTDNPRFGDKTHGVGTFWIPAHARGQKQHGIVQKDYEVHT